ncbi:MAG: AAA family ATPase [Rubrivivax sp.]|nr:AAA family ATPase [Rubrivivax sp.]
MLSKLAAQPSGCDPLDVVAGLRRRFESRGVPVSVIETHISWVLLAGAFAYKIKKPVRFGFLDFGTLEARRRFCEEELRLNRRLAAWLYIGVVPVRATPGLPAFGGSGPVVEYALKMHRLPPHALASERLERGRLDGEQLAAFARRLARFHEEVPAAPPDTDWGTPETVRGDAERALAGLAPLAPPAEREACAVLGRWFEARVAALAPHLAARRAAGRVREGHGDLHLDNVLVARGEVTAFDCIEFDPALRWIDTMNDLGYLMMDLLAHGRRDLAYGVLDAYLEASGDFDGLHVLPLFLVYRAVVRALVHALRSAAHVPGAGLTAADYLRLAQRLAEPGTARLLVTHGLPGAGKTQVARQLLERAGAVRLRSDVERKRLAGLPALADSRAAGDLYRAQASDATYARLELLAGDALRAGFPVIVDAAFLQRAQRERMRALAARLQVPFAILDCQAPLAVLHERVRRRQAAGGDASEADEAVLERLAALEQPLDEAERAWTLTVRTDEPLALAALLGRWQAAAVPRAAPGAAAP